MPITSLELKKIVFSSPKTLQYEFRQCRLPVPDVRN